MERKNEKDELTIWHQHGTLAVLFAVAACILFGPLPAFSQNQLTSATQSLASPVPTVELSPDCRYAGKNGTSSVELPNVAAAIRERKVVRLLVLGSAGTSRQFAGNDQDFLLEHLIEKTVKGLQIEIIDRGISGELARNAAARLEVEVALGRPDAVLWQVGTMDALAGIPASSVRTTVTQSIRWLKAHQVDVVLIGLQYARQLRKDRDYQKIRQTLREITSSEKVMLVERYEAEEILDNVRRAKKDYLESKFDQNERGYNCVAEYVAKAIVGGVLIRQQNRPNPK